METNHKVLKNPLRISMAILLLGITAKIFQMPYAKGILLIAFLAIGILYSIRFWKKSTKGNVDFIKFFLILFWTVNGIFKVLDFSYSLFFQIMTAIFFVVWFIMEGTAYFLDEDRKAKNSLSHILWNCAMVIGTLGIISGSLLRVLDWAYATPLLAFGILLIVAYILKDFFESKKIPEKDKSSGELQL